MSAAEDETEQGSARSVCQLRYLGRNKPGEPQITQGGGSPKWNKFPDSHYLTALWARGPPLTRYRRERLSPCPTASQGDCQAAGRLGLHSQRRGAGLGGTGRIARVPSPEKGPRRGGCES